jgi:hypothetical protein
MTKEDIIRMAKEAGLTKDQHWNRHNMTTAFMCDFANLVAAAEREACAAMFDNHNVWDEEIGERIRARGNT